jgi:hypothetical protein
LNETLANIPRDRIIGLALMKKKLEDADETQPPVSADYLEAKDNLLRSFGYSINTENEQELNRQLSEIVQKMKAHVPMSQL